MQDECTQASTVLGTLTYLFCNIEEVSSNISASSFFSFLKPKLETGITYAIISCKHPAAIGSVRLLVLFGMTLTAL
jgi:hypothetical protein